MIPGITVTIEDKSTPKPQPQRQYPTTTKDENGHILLFPFVVKEGLTNNPSQGKDDKSG